jgi:TolB-like protein/Tfp pilus assembly protein PilF
LNVIDDHKPKLGLTRKTRVGLAAFVLLTVAAIVAGFLWRPGKPKPPTSAAAVRSIAVLPFKPLVADSRNESLELGMADTLINKLSAMRQLRVRPISAVRKYTGLEQDPIAAGRELGVDYVLEGNLQLDADKTRATMRLLDVKEGSAIWADKCDQHCSNVFELQDLVAERIAVALALELTGDERMHLAKHYTDNPEAYQLYSLGLKRADTKEGLEKSILYFEQAKEKDPTYAMAYIGLSVAYGLLGQRGYWVPKEARQRSEWAALKARDLDPTLADAHAILGYFKKMDWDWAGAEKEYKRALKLDPNSQGANYHYCTYLVNVGRADEALAYAKRTDELDPTSPNATDQTAWVYFHLHQYDTAIELYLKAIERNPNSFQRHRFLGEVYVANRMYREGIAELQKAVALNDHPEDLGGYPTLAYAYAMAGNRYDALKILNEQKELAKHRYISPYHFAIIYTGLGDKDRAFECLENAFDDGVQEMPHLHSRPMWDSLRSDPRYTALLRRMNLAQ